LEHLDLGFNNLGDEGAIALSENLPSCLETLILEETNIGDEGCKALSRNLPRSLQKLDLSCNEIGREGCMALMHIIHVEINIKGNDGYYQLRKQWALVRERKIASPKDEELIFPHRAKPDETDEKTTVIQCNFHPQEELDQAESISSPQEELDQAESISSPCCCVL